MAQSILGMHDGIEQSLLELHTQEMGRDFRRESLFDHLVRYLPSTGHALDVGCGTGFMIEKLCQRGLTVTGLETSPPLLDFAKNQMAKLGHTATLVDKGILEAGDFAPVDVVLCLDVIEHIEDEDSTITWLHHHLQKNGWLFVTVPAMPWLWSEYDDDAHHFRRYTRDRLENILSKKFEIKYLTYFNTHLFPPIACVRLLQNMGALNLAGRDKEVGSQGITNAILRAIFASEKIWIPRLKLPFGVSILAVARRSASGST